MNQTEKLVSGHRIVSIDAVRGLVMLIMLIDHVRETVFLHMQVGDPVDVSTTSPMLFILRLMSSFCAPAFVLLAGLGAFLYQDRHSKVDIAKFLFTRGLFLIVLEMLVIGFAWTGVFPPEKFYLQIIWCIGICMVCLAGLIYLPRMIQIFLSLLLVAGHNLLDSIILSSDNPLHFVWAVFHQRDWIEVFGVQSRTSYPVLPWIGVILAGYLIGPWFTKLDSIQRCRKLLNLSIAVLVGFMILRVINVYGDKPWSSHDSMFSTVLGFFALTKYPASLLFLSFTLPFAGFGLILFERYRAKKGVQRLAEFGSGAMFFYVFHLYVLKVIYVSLVAIFGLNQGDYYGVNHPFWVVVWSVGLALPLCWVTVKFVRFKAKNRQMKWLSYF